MKRSRRSKHCSKRANSKIKQPLEADLPPFRNLAASITSCPVRGCDVTAENGKKMGRPTENPRTEKIGFRMSPQEIEDIQLCADALNTQRVNAVVEGINLLKDKLNIPQRKK